jgi:DNA-binding GntR family transcriptional regulator
MHVAEAHEQILRACRDRDAPLAAARMAAHVGELEHLVRHRFRALLNEPTRMLVRG